MSNPKILLIVPAFNESGNISRVLEELSTCPLNPDILVIDDGSSDGTAQIVRDLGHKVVSLPFNLGIGGAVQTGFLYGWRHNYDLAVQVDGDGQHDPSFLPALLEPVIKGEVDIAVGSRFIGPFQDYRSSLPRRVGILFFARLISFLTGCPTTDSTSGFRAFNRRAMALFARHYPLDFPEPESIVMAHRRGLRLTEVPVRMRQRLHGASSIRYLKTLYYMVKVTFAVLLDMIKPFDREG